MIFGIFWRGFLYLSLFAFYCVSLNSFPLTSVKTQLEQKKWLPVQRTTLWASSSLTRVSLALFSSTSSQPFPSENLFRNTLGKWKSHFFLQHNNRSKIWLFLCAPAGIWFFLPFFVCLGKGWIFFAFTCHLGLTSFFD